MAKCKICRQEFVKRSISHKCCGQDCAYKFVQIEKERKARRETRKRLIELKPLSWYRAKAQKAVNAYRRAEDMLNYGTCISCGCKLEIGNTDAGHFYSRGAYPELSLEPWNIHAQCARPCNHDLSGNIHKFRKGLENRYGMVILNFLDSHHEAKHYTRDDYLKIEDEYKAKLKELKNDQT